MNISNGIPLIKFMLGPLGFSLTNVLFSFILLFETDDALYGLYSFGLVLQGLFIGVSNSIVSTMPKKFYKNANGVIAVLFMQVLISIVCISLYLCISIGADTNVYYAASLIIVCFMSCMRWGFRNLFYIQGSLKDVEFLDLLFLMLIFFIFATCCFFGVSLFNSFVLSSSASCLACIVIFLYRFRWAFMLSFSWKRVFVVGRCSGVGINIALGAEASSNIVPYYISALYGASLYAPIAAASLFFRPFTLLQSSISQYFRLNLRLRDNCRISSELERSLNIAFLFLFSVNFLCLIVFFIIDVFFKKMPDTTVIGIVVIFLAMIIRSFRQKYTLIVSERLGYVNLAKYIWFSVFISSPLLFLSVFGVEYSLLFLVFAEIVLSSILITKFNNLTGRS